LPPRQQSKALSCERAAYLEDGLPPNAQWGIKSDVRLPQDTLKDTLSYLAVKGPRDFYEGIWRAVLRPTCRWWRRLSVEDLAPSAHVASH